MGLGLPRAPHLKVKGNACMGKLPGDSIIEVICVGYKFLLIKAISNNSHPGHKWLILIMNFVVQEWFS